MIRFSLSGIPVEIKAWRLVVWLAWYGLACVFFDSLVWSWWADVPVELGFVPVLEWVFPAFGLYPMARAAVEAVREIRRLRAERRDAQ